MAAGAASDPTVQMLARRALRCSQSPMGANIAFIRFKYDIDFCTSLKTRAQSIRTYHQLNAVQCDYMDVLFTLRNCINGSQKIGFNSTEIAAFTESMYID